VVDVDAAGLYATLMRYGLYKNHEFQPFGDALGPDFEMGMQLRRQGYKNYADFHVWLDHLKPDGTAISRLNTKPVQFRLIKNNGKWTGEIL
jgi:hypothetical protein